jgi:hypothetical protein
MDNEREALVSLTAWSVGQDRFVTIQPDEALRALGAGTRNRTRASPRLVLLERLARVTSRRGEELLAIAQDPLRELLSALFDTRDVDNEGLLPASGVGALPPPDEDPVEALTLALERIARAGPANAPADAYAILASAALHHLELRAYEMAPPACDDTTVETAEGVVERTVEAEFFSPLAFDRFADWLDPPKWPGLCSWFFRDMIELRPRKKLAMPGSWNAIYDEQVQLDPAVVWTTCLFFFGLGNEQRLSTTYRLASPADIATHFAGGPVPPPAPDHPLHLTVDHGVLIAEKFGTESSENKSRLRLSKTVAFTETDLVEWVTVMCDTFWLDLAIAMAHKAAFAANN